MEAPTPATSAENTTKQSAFLGHVARHLRITGWCLLTGGTLGILLAVLMGKLQPLVGGAILVGMGRQALRAASAATADAPAEEVLQSLGRAYVRQSWLVVTWIVFLAVIVAVVAPR